jgi:hypothetical protein
MNCQLNIKFIEQHWLTLVLVHNINVFSNNTTNVIGKEKGRKTMSLIQLHLQLSGGFKPQSNQNR